MDSGEVSELELIWDEARVHIERGNYDKTIEIYKMSSSSFWFSLVINLARLSIEKGKVSRQLRAAFPVYTLYQV